MENKKIQEMFTKAIIKDGFEKYSTDTFMKHVSNDDLLQIHNKVYEFYKIELDNDRFVANDTSVDNLNELMCYFIEREDYEKCAVIRDQLSKIK